MSMNKYQEFALMNAGYGVWKDDSFSSETRVDSKNGNWSCILETDGKIIVKQDDNYNITKYFIRFQPTIDKAIVNGKDYVPQMIGTSSYLSVVIPVDFENPIKEIILSFNGVIEPMTIPVEFVAADRKIFDDKMEKERQTNLAQLACIKVSTSDDLVNIYFQPCSDNYKKTIIELYLASGTYSKIASGAYPINFVFHPQLLSATPVQMIVKFKVEDGMMFKSITGLAKGAYGFKLAQYDNKGNLLFKTDYQYFQIG